jgi:hypothetical protein
MPLRGGRKNVQERPPGAEGIVEVAPLPPSQSLRKRWAYRIHQVYEADPRFCPRCRCTLGERATTAVPSCGLGKGHKPSPGGMGAGINEDFPSRLQDSLIDIGASAVSILASGWPHSRNGCVCLR